MAASAASPSNLGFLTILKEPAGYLGGYLVTNPWGRPLEFRLSTPVQPNRVQQILYGDSLEPYICADLIGKTLLDKTAAAAQIVVTDQRAALELRRRIDVPMAWVGESSESDGLQSVGFRNLQCLPDFTQDSPLLREQFARYAEALDLNEPFVRIREAIAEARKMGVANRG
jgi:hypothetical protein